VAGTAVEPEPLGAFLVVDEAEFAVRLEKSGFGETVAVDFDREAVLWVNYMAGVPTPMSGFWGTS